ncbi:oxaloacetate decarboxylase [Thermodesulfobacteriota bacterium]
MRKTTQLRKLLEEPGIIPLPGAYDAISARIIEDAGFKAVAITGGGISRSKCMPDAGLMTMTEVLDQTKTIAEAVNVPVIADCDTGYGNALNLMRTVREFERIGVAALFFEDQETPKKCGKYAGVNLISQEEMVKKIQAAIDARTDPDFVIIARVMARPIAGLDEMIKRGKAYAKAGADILKVRGLQSLEELEQVAKAIPCPLSLNWPELQSESFDDLQPFPGINTVKDLEKMGYKMVKFASDLMRAAMKAMMEAAAVLKNEGSMKSYAHRQVHFADRERIIGTYKFQELEKKYLI